MNMNHAVCTQALPNNRFHASGTTFLQRVLLWHDRARQRRQLASLDDRSLRDIGVDRASALFEASKPFWRD